MKKYAIVISIISLLVLTVFLIGCGEEQAGEAFRFTKKTPPKIQPVDVKPFQKPVFEVKPTVNDSVPHNESMSINDSHAVNDTYAGNYTAPANASMLANESMPVNGTHPVNDTYPGNYSAPANETVQSVNGSNYSNSTY